MKKVYLVDRTRCTLHSCGRPCIEKCPVGVSDRRRKENAPRIPVPIRHKQSDDTIIIKSEHCVRCGTCANVCPMKAIYVRNILEEDETKEPTHEYPGAADGHDRGFRLYGLPTLMAGRVTGLCGPNGIGKSTVLNILSGKLAPNFGDTAEVNKKNALQDAVSSHVKEAEMRDHFQGLAVGALKVAYKEQVLRVLFDKYRDETVMEIVRTQAAVDNRQLRHVVDALDLVSIQERMLDQCSGGELQRFAIALVLVAPADVYLIDEPCTFLDVKKRIQLAKLLHERASGYGDATMECPVLVVEHDLAILDYISDVIHLFYGVPHDFGVVTGVQTTKQGINSYLDGYIKAENLTFRENAIAFKKSVGGRRWDNARVFSSFGHITKTFESFSLKVEPGTIYQSEVLGIVGENGLGKSTLAKILAGKLDPDLGSEQLDRGVSASVSYKPQYITKDHEGTVREFIVKRSLNYDFSEPMLKSLYRPLGVDRLLDKPVKELSGGELQRAFIVSCLAARASLYVLDEPSAYLDVEERLHVSSVIRSATKASNATTICIEHDLQIADALVDRLLIFEGEPGKHGHTIGPLDKREGMNAFLKSLDVTFRRDEETGRARINKKDSQRDRYQRSVESYFHE